jgi:hypothetical protein
MFLLGTAALVIFKLLKTKWRLTLIYSTPWRFAPQVHCTNFQIKTKPMRAMCVFCIPPIFGGNVCSALLDKYSITLRVIQSSGQAELVERCLRNPAVFAFFAGFAGSAWLGRKRSSFFKGKF